MAIVGQVEVDTTNEVLLAADEYRHGVVLSLPAGEETVYIAFGSDVTAVGNTDVIIIEAGNKVVLKDSTQYKKAMNGATAANSTTLFGIHVLY